MTNLNDPRIIVATEKTVKNLCESLSDIFDILEKEFGGNTAGITLMSILVNVVGNFIQQHCPHKQAREVAYLDFINNFKSFTERMEKSIEDHKKAMN